MQQRDLSPFLRHSSGLQFDEPLSKWKVQIKVELKTIAFTSAGLNSPVHGNRLNFKCN